ncbi:hypothetical protein ACFLYT_00175 [Nanoarchaeota archaeon]
MKIKNKWGKIDSWIKGSIIGLIIGVSYIPFGLGVGSSSYSFFLWRAIFYLWDLVAGVYLAIHCKLLSIPQGESCAFSAMYGSLLVIPLLFLIIGGLIGLLVDKSKK